MTGNDQRQSGPQEVEPQSFGLREIGDARGEDEDRDAKDNARNDQRDQHQHIEELLAGEVVALEQEGVAGTDRDSQQRDPEGDEGRGANSSHQRPLGKDAKPRRLGAEEPVEREALPRQ